MKITKVLAVSLSTVFSLSCFGTFGMEKFTCLSCRKESTHNSRQTPFCLGCKLGENDERTLCRNCFSKFNKLCGGYVIDSGNGPYSHELNMMRCCIFCDNSNITTTNRSRIIRELFNSNLPLRVKSFIYKVAKYHDEKKGTNFAATLRQANQDYFDYLDQISLCDDNDVELNVSPFFSNRKLIFDVQEDGEDLSKNTCIICYQAKSLNNKKICSSVQGHGKFICKSCLGILVMGNKNCPICKSALVIQRPSEKPLPDNFN